MLSRKLTAIREKHLDRWLGGYVRHLLRPRPRPAGRQHLLFAVCDHYEPEWKQPDHETAVARVAAWADGYPDLARDFRDADGRPPQHSFFFPGEEYHDDYFDLLDPLIAAGYGEVELHLHHDDATAETMRADVERFLAIFAERGHLARDPASGQLRYAFIHGNWCLANARPDGRWCGVDAELPLLFDTGCYADFTFPAAPDVSQSNRVNEIYWPTGDLARRRSYEQGERARVGTHYIDRLLMITGPLALSRRAGRASLRLEYGALTAHDHADATRVKTWVDQGICIEGRPEWVFVKVYTHGAPEAQGQALLGDGGRALHEALRHYNDGGHWKLHYVTAREMYNIAQAAMRGRSGDPNDYRDYLLPPPPIRKAQ
ncbi:MAG: hypothetical protein AAGA56_14810 [Myxococcota bacterium]